MSVRPDNWSINATRTVQSFFQLVVEQVLAGQIDEARELFSYLGEPNETCLGLSTDAPRGRGVGEHDADKIFESILQSHAIQTGLVNNIADCQIFVEGVGDDKISDMTTNIIRNHLIEYTQAQCRFWDIPLRQNIASGYFWDRASRRWDNQHTDMLVIDDRRILLVPKSIVSYCKVHKPNRYYMRVVLDYLRDDHLQRRSHLLRQRKLKRGRIIEYVRKKDVEEEHPYSKKFIRDFTANHPTVFQSFENFAKQQMAPLSNEDFERYIQQPDVGTVIDYLITRLGEVPAGADDATTYHRLMVGALELIFYPDLTCPVVEQKIHAGRKRIDITFDNSAKSGYFYYLHDTKKISSAYIFVECKNYSREIANPELDQMGGRFSPNRGKFGLILSRTLDNMDLFIARCRDTFADDIE